jgi:hypothetical protein
MPLIFRYFWFFAAVIMLANIFIWRRRSDRAVGSGVVSRDEFDQFLRWASIWLVGVPLLLGLISLGAKWSSPLCARTLSFADLPHTLFSSVILLTWGSCLWWVWRGSGAEFIAHVLPLVNQNRMSELSFSPQVIRLAVTALVIVGAVGTQIMWQATPIAPEIACPVSTVEG